VKKSIYSKRVLTSEGLNETTILIENGKIEKVYPGKWRDENVSFDDVGDSVVMPGLIDPHVHINEPGRVEWEGFETATLAAAASGITTLIEMPLNASPVTTTVNALKIKTEAAKGKLHVNCGFWGGLVPQNLNEVEKLVKAGVFGIKAFMTHSGIDDFPNVSEEHLRKAMPILAKYNVPLLVHAELDWHHQGQEELKKNPTSYRAYLNSRPKEWEDEAIKMLIRLCEATRCSTHIVHLSSANSLQQIVQAKAMNLPLTVETAQHYLFFNAEDIPDGNTKYKCAPPIREKENNEQLWEGLKNGTIDFVATDHSPSTPELKELNTGNLLKAWGGIAGLQFSLPAFWTKAEEKGFSIADVSRLLSYNVAKFLGMDKRKGKIAEGYDADLVVWDPELSFFVMDYMIHHKHKETPYLHHELKGIVKYTYLGGEKIFDRGMFVTIPYGKVITPKTNSNLSKGTEMPKNLY
jgi:allantoinase